MDDVEQIFSPEALRSLFGSQGFGYAQDPDSISFWENPSIDSSHHAHDTTRTPTEVQLKTKNSQKGRCTFPASGGEGPSHKRAKFQDPRRRAEVAQVRKEGACMRCRWNKIPVCKILEDPGFRICKISYYLVLEYTSLRVM